MADESFEDVCINIKACLNSVKERMSVSGLARDYREIVGSSIPFRKLGYTNLEELLRAIPKLRLININNELYIDVKPDEKTAHIKNLVLGQNNSKKKSKKGRFSRGPVQRNYNTQHNRTNNYSTSRFNNYNKNNYNGYYAKQTDYENDMKQDSNYLYHKYRSTQPSQYDFSDGEDYEDDFLDHDYSPPSDEFRVPTSNRIEEAKEGFKNLHITVGNNSFGSGTSNTSVRGGFRNQRGGLGRPTSSHSQDDDIGYSSMNNGQYSQEVDDWDDTICETNNNCYDWNDTVCRDDDWDDSVVVVDENAGPTNNDFSNEAFQYERVNQVKSVIEEPYSKRNGEIRSFRSECRANISLRGKGSSKANFWGPLKGQRKVTMVSLAGQMNNELMEDDEDRKPLLVTIKNGSNYSRRVTFPKW